MTTLDETVTTIDAEIDRPVAPAAPVRLRRRPRPAWYGVLTLTLITSAFVFSDSSYLFTVNLCLLAAFGAISLDLLKGTVGLVSIGNAGFMAVGAFVTIFAIHLGLPFPLDIIAGALAAGAIGLPIGLPALRLRGLHLFLATMAGHYLIVHFARHYQLHSEAGGHGGFFVTPLFTSKGLDGAQVYWAWTLLFLLSVVILIVSRLVRDRSGRAWRTIRDHEVVAHTLGINVTRYKILAFVISSTVIGLQGGLMAHFTGTVSTETFTFHLAIGFVVMVVVGGLDSIAGAVVGASIVTALPIVLPKLLGLVLSDEAAIAKGPSLATVLYGLLVVIFITSSPDGTVGLVRSLRDRLFRAVRSRRGLAGTSTKPRVGTR